MNSSPSPKDRIVFSNPSERIKYNVRSSQAILQYGVGAMVDFPDQTLMTAAPKHWADKVIKIYDERLQRALGVKYFGMPGGSDEPQFREGISYTRFPQWYFCPKCRRFQPIKDWFKEYKRKVSSKQLERDPYMKTPCCPECKQDLVDARIIVACEQGHIDDFPWVAWVHRRNIGGPKKSVIIHILHSVPERRRLLVWKVSALSARPVMQKRRSTMLLTRIFLAA